jgi:ABC-2 type transport system permease protein
LTYFLTILRGVLLKGVGLGQLWTPSLVLAGFAIGLVVLSVVRFHKTVE